jgi:adenosylhomocysteine nucleosidase
VFGLTGVCADRLVGLFALSLVFCGTASGASEKTPSTAVVVSANAEWRPFRGLFPEAQVERSPFGEYFIEDLEVGGAVEKVVFLHGGWGKISAAASAQYVIDRWSPRLLVNLGTCGGFKGAVEPGDVLLVEKTIVYDIVEKMGDASEAIAEYTTRLDLDWLQPPYPTPVKRTSLVSADRDLFPEDLDTLRKKYGAVAGDWESGAIAWVASRNHTRTLILRAVSDVVDREGGEAYGNLALFEARTKTIMKNLAEILPLWIARALEKETPR